MRSKYIRHLVIWIILSTFTGFLGIYNYTTTAPSPALTSNVSSGKVNKTYLQDKQCLVQALWNEARGEPLEGMRSVAKVIQNRVNTKGFPGDYCGVIHQRGQFTYRNHSRKLLEAPRSSLNDQGLYLVHQVAEEALTGRLRASVGEDALWYHSVKVKPTWSTKMKLVSVHGGHVFYKM